MQGKLHVKFIDDDGHAIIPGITTKKALMRKLAEMHPSVELPSRPNPTSSSANTNSSIPIEFNPNLATELLGQKEDNFRSFIEDIDGDEDDEDDAGKKGDSKTKKSTTQNKKSKKKKRRR